MTKLFLSAALLLSLNVHAQKASSVSSTEATRIINFLASDELAGRYPGTPGIDKAADFIAAEFKKAGLKPLSGDSYLQSFSVLQPRLTLLKAEVNGQDYDTKKVIVVTTRKEFKANEKDNYRLVRLTRAEAPTNQQIQSFLRKALQPKGPALVVVDTAFASIFPRLTYLKRALFQDAHDVVLLLAPEVPAAWTVKAEHTFTETRMANVVGILPGKAQAAEQVIFSGHYDHVGIGKPVEGDSIYNGANDDASGITSMILLAQHYAKQKNNARTLVFAAFTAEESGGFGATWFSQQLDPEKVVAMFNIEMVGTESKWGKASAFITGVEKSSFGTILQNNLKGTGFNFYPDPYPEQNLFYRSDNATLARLGVPAHTISTSKMDVEPHYHKPSDEVKTLDMENLAKVTEAIAKSAAGIGSGKDTPTRVTE